jgi:hypothetical protein
MKKKSSPSRAAKSTNKKEAELLAIELPADLLKGMDIVGITDREEYIRFLIASSLLNYPRIWKEEKELETKLQKIKLDADHQNYLR